MHFIISEINQSSNAYEKDIRRGDIITEVGNQIINSIEEYNTIIEEYNWEKAVDTNSTWRIGDGTASFYNYVYTLIAGFSENDTFRSNQIREGSIKRKDALKIAFEENYPRYESLKCYLTVIGLDFESTIKKINQIPKLY